VMSCAIVLAHRALRQREALHTGAKFYSETCTLEPASIPSDLAMVASPAELPQTNKSNGLHWRTAPIAHLGITRELSESANREKSPPEIGRPDPDDATIIVTRDNLDTFVDRLTEAAGIPRAP